MGRKAGGVNFNRLLLAKLADRAQHFDFVVDIQPVAGFYFNRCYAFRQQMAKTPAGADKQFILVCGSGGAHG